MQNLAEIKQNKLLIMVLAIEGCLFLISLIWGYIAEINPFSNIYFNYIHLIIAFLASAFILLVNFLAINVLPRFNFFFKHLKEAYEDVAGLAANVTIPGAFIIALISGFTEEFFFRGIIQVQFGIVVASIVFGLFHIGNIKTISYGIYAILIGFYLGWLYVYTGNLLVSIIVHFINNFFAIPYMRYYYRKHIYPILLEE